ncbi:MAG: hypothetical protein ABR920_02050 [Terriglobales bacterium]
MNNRLTLNLGIRYDYYTWPYEIHNQQSNWDPTNGTLFRPGSTEAAGLPRSLINNDKNDWAPRIGLAYDLLGNGKTVLRGGYGIFYFLDRGGVGNQLSNNPEFNGVSSYLACPGGNCADPTGYRNTLRGQGPQGDNNWLDATGALPPDVSTVVESNPQHVNVIYYPSNSKNSSIQQWNVQFEREFAGNTAWHLAYVGTKMSNLATAFNANQTPLGGGPSRWSGRGRQRVRLHWQRHLQRAANQCGPPHGDDPDNRRDFPGGFPGDPRNAFTASGRTAEQQDVFAHV